MTLLKATSKRLVLPTGEVVELIKASYYPRVAEKGRTVQISCEVFRNDALSRKEEKTFKLLGENGSEGVYGKCVEGMRIGEIRSMTLKGSEIGEEGGVMLKIELTSIEEELPDFNFFCEGNGEKGTILFMHGWPDDENLFRPQIDFFKEKGFRCLFYSLPWYGKKEKIEGDSKRFHWDKHGYSHEDLVDAIAAKAYNAIHGGKSVDEVPEKLFVFAHDWGSLEAQIFKVRHDHLVNLTVLLDIESFDTYYFPTWKIGLVIMYLGYYYQYRLIASFLLQDIFPVWSKEVHEKSVNRIKDQLKDKSIVVNHGSVMQNYVYVNFHKDILLRIMGLKESPTEFYVPGSLEKRDMKTSLMQNTMFLFGNLKPVMFHRQGTERLLNSDKPEMIKSCAKGIRAKHWISLDEPQEVNNLTLRYFLDPSATASDVKKE